MRKVFVVFLFFSVPYFNQAQNLSFSLMGGFSNYQGDLQKAKFTFSQAKAAYGAGINFEATNRFTIRFNVAGCQVSASDKENSVNKSRNLSFTSSISEIHLGLEYDLINVYEKGYSLYLLAGIGYFHFDPWALDSTGHKVYLQPLGTEGEGFYQGRKKYALNGVIIPFGGGMKFALSEDVFLRLEAGIRKTFTDYLDDVSTTYADRQALLNNNGAKAVEMAFRGGELNPAYHYPPQGTIRGSAKRKDYYYIIGAAISFRLKSRSDNRYLKRSHVGCPVNVY